jgi:parvulin-like peptidyl-prolyl isomerase
LTRRASPVAGRTFPWEGLDEERRGALLLYGAIGFVLVFAAVLIGWGYYKDKIAPRHEAVLTVGNRNFDVRFIERRFKTNYLQGQFRTATSIQDAVVKTVQAIELEEMTRIVGREAGVYPSDDDIDNEIRSRLNLPEGVERNTFAAAYRQEVLRIGLPVNEYREVVASQIISTRLEAQYKDSIPDQLEQVDAQIIKVADEAKAKEAKARLDAGDKFNVTAASFSTDASKSSGGELGWIAKAELAPKAAEALFTIPIGQISDPILDRDGWYIVLARGREVRDVDAGHKQTIAQKTFDNSVQDARVRVGSKNRLTEEQILNIAQNVLGK